MSFADRLLSNGLQKVPLVSVTVVITTKDGGLVHFNHNAILANHAKQQEAIGS